MVDATGGSVTRLYKTRFYECLVETRLAGFLTPHAELELKIDAQWRQSSAAIRTVRFLSLVHAL
jgi:hypothetical protein